jgi:hypothetical protein
MIGAQARLGSSMDEEWILPEFPIPPCRLRIVGDPRYKLAVEGNTSP